MYPNYYMDICTEQPSTYAHTLAIFTKGVGEKPLNVGNVANKLQQYE